MDKNISKCGNIHVQAGYFNELKINVLQMAWKVSLQRASSSDAFIFMELK